ncbi:MAG: formylglycine-generating enzyme family protein, partial [Bdellovibrionales bacterium]
MKSVTFLLFLAFSLSALGKEVKLTREVYVPVFRDPGETDVAVGPLFIDETPVTNQEFLSFIKKHPQFAKSKIPALYADGGYLSHWTSDTAFKKSEANFPVTHVSWFAARKYCAAQGKRLPTIAEWEVASDSQNPKIEARRLEWYAEPGSKLRSGGKEPGHNLGGMEALGL